MKEFHDNTTPEQRHRAWQQRLHNAPRTRNLVAIMAGLLASGHYTYQSKDDYAEPALKKFDVGDDWQEQNRECKRVKCVLEDAEEILDDIETRAVLAEEEEERLTEMKETIKEIQRGNHKQ